MRVLEVYILFNSVVPGPSSMCCTEYEDSPRHLNSVNLSQQQPVFDSFLSLIVIDVTAHCHQQCASTHLANSASPIYDEKYEE